MGLIQQVMPATVKARDQLVPFNVQGCVVAPSGTAQGSHYCTAAEELPMPMAVILAPSKKLIQATRQQERGR